MRDLRALLIVEATAFGVAAALHSGMLTRGPYESAPFYESTIALVLIVGLAVAITLPRWTRAAALAAQGFALAGSMIGLYLAIRGVGPNSIPDMVFHVAIVGFLVWGLTTAWRAAAPGDRASLDPRTR